MATHLFLALGSHLEPFQPREEMGPCGHTESSRKTIYGWLKLTNPPATALSPCPLL